MLKIKNRTLFYKNNIKEVKMNKICKKNSFLLIKSMFFACENAKKMVYYFYHKISVKTLGFLP